MDIDYVYASIHWVKGHGACFTSANHKPLHIDWIYGKNRLQLLYYNLILAIRYYKRKFDRRKRNGSRVNKNKR